MEQESSSVTVRARGPSGGETLLRAPLLAACDGAGSPLAGFLGLRRRVRRFPVAFRMGDYRDESGLGPVAHLYFTRLGSVESFPMPGGLRRWIVQATGAEEPEPSFEKVEAQVLARTGQRLDPGGRVWASAFRPERTELERFRAGRVVFCGDAAHTMPPIGGQGMNTGFADARLLARVLERCRGEETWRTCWPSTSPTGARVSGPPPAARACSWAWARCAPLLRAPCATCSCPC